MKSKSKILIILVAICFLPAFLSSCADSKDINEKSILTTVALDKKGDQIYLYFEIANITGDNKSESKSNKYIYVKGHGKTISEARENLNRQLEKWPYASAVRTLIFTEDFAKEHLVEYLYRLRADELYRKKTITVITKEDPEEIFKINTENDISVGFAIEGMLKTLEKTGKSFCRTTTRLLENLSDKYTGFLIPCIGLQDNENSLIGYSVVNGSTIDGFLPVEDSRGMIFLKTDKAQIYYVIPYKENEFTIEVSLKNRKTKPYYEDGKINFDIKCNFEAKLMYGNKKTPYNFDDTYKEEVTIILTELLKNELSVAVKQAQEEFDCDYLQFDDEFRIKYPVEFEKMDWINEFSKVSFNFDVKVKLSGTWMMDYEFYESK